MIDSLAHNPQTETELAVQLDDPSWCASYAFRLRWPHGFVCPTCGAADKGYVAAQKPLCRACGRSTSITAGTLLHGSKKSLVTWLQALWWVSGQRSSISITKLKNHLGFTSHQTAWAWMKKLRYVIHLVNQKKCRGIVLVDTMAADDRGGENRLLAAVESVARGRSTGRLQMVNTDVLNQEMITRFCRHAVTPGSIIIVPGREPFASVNMREMIYTVDDSTSHHEDLVRISACYRLWCRQKKIRWSARRSADDLLDEFCYFYNGTRYTDRVHLFETLVSVALHYSQDDFAHPKEKSVSQGGVP